MLCGTFNCSLALLPIIEASAGLREAAICKPGQGTVLANCRLNGVLPMLTRGAAAMRIHTHRDESRSWHLDLIGGRVHPWSIDLVVVIVSGILLIGLACALAAHLIR